MKERNRELKEDRYPVSGHAGYPEPGKIIGRLRAKSVSGTNLFVTKANQPIFKSCLYGHLLCLHTLCRLYLLQYLFEIHNKLGTEYQIYDALTMYVFFLENYI